MSKIVEYTIIAACVAALGSIIGFWYTDVEVTTEPSVASRVRLATINACGRAVGAGHTSASVWYLGVEFPVEMEFEDGRLSSCTLR